MNLEINHDQLVKAELMPDLTLFVACYNEEELIIETLETVLHAMAGLTISYEVLIIDDASKDNSHRLVADFIAAKSLANFRLYKNNENKGLGYNYVEAAFLGRGKYFRYMSGDNAEPEETLILLYSKLGAADMVLPYHEVKIVGRSMLRDFISKLYTFIINFLSGYRLKYYNGSGIHLRQNILRWHSYLSGFGFQADFVVRMLDQGFSYIEIGVRGREVRQHSKSSAFKFKNFLSVAQVMFDILLRRLINSPLTKPKP